MDGPEEVVVQVAALLVVYVVCGFTTRGELYVQPVSRAGYSNVSQRHFGRCFTFPRSLQSYLFDLCSNPSMMADNRKEESAEGKENANTDVRAHEKKVRMMFYTHCAIPDGIM